jgi:hypothetical protein
MADQNDSKLVWTEVDSGHLRAATGDVFDYDIIHAAGQISWQGLEFGEWKYEESVDAAKAAAQAEFDSYRSRNIQSL